jgi:hypothetical protein
MPASSQARCALEPLRVYSDLSLGWNCVEDTQGGLLSIRNRPFTLAYGVMLMLGMAGLAVAQDSGEHRPSGRQRLQHDVHTPQSIDRNLPTL